MLVAVASGAAALLLGAGLSEQWSLRSTPYAVAAAAMAILSAVLAEVSVLTIVKGWLRREPPPGEALVFELGRLGRALRRPVRLILTASLAAGVMAAAFLWMPSPAAESPLPPGELVIMTGFPDVQNDPRSILFRQWEQLHPDNPVRISYAPGEPDEQFRRMVNDARPNGAHDADVYALDIIWMSTFIDQDYIRPLTGLAAEDRGDFVPKVLDTCVCGGTLWALPFYTDVGLIFYRSDLVPPPETWDDYSGRSAKSRVAAAQQQDERIEAANAAQLADAEMLTITALEAIWAAGGQLVTSEGEVTLDNDTGVFISTQDENGIRQLADAAKDPEIMLPQAREMTELEAVNAFAEGRTLYMRNWPLASDQIGDRVEYDVVAPPTASALGGQNLAISAHSDNSEAALALIEFLTSPSSQLILSEISAFPPARESAYSIADRPDIPALRAALDAARPRLKDPNYLEFSQIFREGIGRALNHPEGELEGRFGPDLAAAVDETPC